MDEQRLPFPVHGTRLDAGDPLNDASLGDAARLLYFANLIASTADVPIFSMQQQMPYGTVTASVHGPLAFKGVRVNPPQEEEEEEEDGPSAQPTVKSARLVWLPEGFVITPRTSAAPKGYGMPPTEDGKGTPGGPLREVIINRFKGNQYPDAVAQVVDEAFTPSPERRAIAAGLFYMPWEAVEGPFGVGVWAEEGGEDVFKPQFKGRFDTHYAEAESENWYCHRPMYHLGADDAFQKEVRDLSNALRTKALGPELRGFEGEASSTILYSMKESRVQAHASPFFKEGHQSFNVRTSDRTGGSSDQGENLAVHPGNKDGVAAARDAMTGWENSPPHLANIVSKDWDTSKDVYGCVDAAFVHDSTIANVQQSPFKDDSPVAPLSPPIVGTSFAQIFAARREFIHPALCGGDALTEDRFGEAGRSSDGGSVGVRPQGHAFQAYQLIDFDDPDDRPPVYLLFRGRVIQVSEQASSTFAVLAARIVRSGEHEMLRIITADRFGDGADIPVNFIVRQGLLHDFLKTQVELSRFALPEDVGVASSVRFSESGDKAVFCYTVAEPALDNRRWYSDSDPPYTAPTVWPYVKQTEYRATADDRIWPYYGVFGPLWHRVQRTYDERDARQYVWGDVMHFVEWTVDGGWTEVLTDSIDINFAYKRFSPGQDADQYNPDRVGVVEDLPGYIEDESYTFDASLEYCASYCVGSYKLFADYSGESMVFAEVAIDSKSNHALFGQSDRTGVEYGPAFGDGTPRRLRRAICRRKLHAKFVFPGGEELVFRDTFAGYDTGLPLPDAANQLAGHFLQFLYVDIMRPASCVYVRHDISGDSKPKSKSSIVAHEKVVKDLDDCLMSEANDQSMMAVYASGLSVYSTKAMNTSVIAGLEPYTIKPCHMQSYASWEDEGVQPPPDADPYLWSNYKEIMRAKYGPMNWAVGETGLYGDKAQVSFFGYGGDRLPPWGPYKASLVSHGLGTANQGRFRGNKDWYATIYHDLVGPEIAMPVFDPHHYVEVALYKDEHIVAGEVGNTLGAEEHSWQDDDRYFYSSSLDLKAITGLSDLKQNIMPIGVL